MHRSLTEEVRHIHEALENHATASAAKVDLILASQATLASQVNQYATEVSLYRAQLDALLTSQHPTNNNSRVRTGALAGGGAGVMAAIGAIGKVMGWW